MGQSDTLKSALLDTVGSIFPTYLSSYNSQANIVGDNFWHVKLSSR